MITSAQMRAARAILGQSQKELAEASGVSVPTIQRMENSPDTVRSNVNTLVKIIAVFESLGVSLIQEGEVSTAGGRGVRMVKRD